MKDNARLGFFISLILLASVPKNPSIAVSDFLHLRPVVPQLLPLTQFLKIALERVRAPRVSPQVNQTAAAGLIFRLGTPE